MTALRVGAVLGSGALLLLLLAAGLLPVRSDSPLLAAHRAGHLIALLGAVGLLHPQLGWTIAGAAGTGLSALSGAYQAVTGPGPATGPLPCAGAVCELAQLPSDGARIGALSGALLACWALLLLHAWRARRLSR